MHAYVQGSFKVNLTVTFLTIPEIVTPRTLTPSLCLISTMTLNLKKRQGKSVEKINFACLTLLPRRGQK